MMQTLIGVICSPCVYLDFLKKCGAYLSGAHVLERAIDGITSPRKLDA
jgi:hypothetical protein